MIKVMYVALCMGGDSGEDKLIGRWVVIEAVIRTISSYHVKSRVREFGPFKSEKKARKFLKKAGRLGAL